MPPITHHLITHELCEELRQRTRVLSHTVEMIESGRHHRWLCQPVKPRHTTCWLANVLSPEVEDKTGNGHTTSGVLKCNLCLEKHTRATQEHKIGGTMYYTEVRQVPATLQPL